MARPSPSAEEIAGLDDVLLEAIARELHPAAFTPSHRNSFLKNHAMNQATRILRIVRDHLKGGGDVG